MKITKEEVERVAHLARLNLNRQELEKMTEQLDNILSYVAKLGELDTENITRGYFDTYVQLDTVILIRLWSKRHNLSQ